MVKHVCKYLQSFDLLLHTSIVLFLSGGILNGAAYILPSYDFNWKQVSYDFNLKKFENLKCQVLMTKSSCSHPVVNVFLFSIGLPLSRFRDCARIYSNARFSEFLLYVMFNPPYSNAQFSCKFIKLMRNFLYNLMNAFFTWASL